MLIIKGHSVFSPKLSPYSRTILFPKHAMLQVSRVKIGNKYMSEHVSYRRGSKNAIQSVHFVFSNLLCRRTTKRHRHSAVERRRRTNSTLRKTGNFWKRSTSGLFFLLRRSRRASNWLILDRLLPILTLLYLISFLDRWASVVLDLQGGYSIYKHNHLEPTSGMQSESLGIPFEERHRDVDRLSSRQDRRVGDSKP